MDTTTVAALGRCLIGGMTTLATTWHTQRYGMRSQLLQATQGADDKSGSDAIAQFSRACREELEALQRRV